MTIPFQERSVTKSDFGDFGGGKSDLLVTLHLGQLNSLLHMVNGTVFRVENFGRSARLMGLETYLIQRGMG